MTKILEIAGGIAGLAGLSIGLIIIIFREIIRKNIFPRLTVDKGYKILKQISTYAFIVAIAGIASYTYGNYLKSRIADSRTIFGTLIGDNLKNIESAIVEIREKPGIRDESDSDGNFMLTLDGTQKEIVELKITHPNYKDYRKKIEIDFRSTKDKFDLHSITLKSKEPVKVVKPKIKIIKPKTEKTKTL